MTKSILTILLLLSIQIGIAQNFTESMGTPFEGVVSSSIAFSDVNGDGNEDVLITGRNTLSVRIAKLYINNGTGTFTEMIGTPFEAVSVGSVAFTDVNGDGSDDVLITGRNGFADPIAKLYTNDGAGTFTEMTDTPLEGVATSSIAFSDVDDDGDEDVVITGQNSSDEPIAKLYLNDGTGIFTEETETPFEGVFASSIAFSDVNSDGNEDVLIAGNADNLSSSPITKLYINDGTGVFTEMMDTPFEGVWRGSSSFSDVNGDGFVDLLITGWNSLFEPIAKLYSNDGTGNFIETTGTPFDGVFESSIAFSDFNEDGYEDVLITGENSSEEPIAKLYTNDGTGTFTEIIGTPFDGVRFSSIAISDTNGDGIEDILITGLNSSSERIAKLYITNGMVSATEGLNTGNILDFTLFPNPSASSTLHLSYNSALNSALLISIYGVDGVLINQQRELVSLGEQTFSINLSSLEMGTYLIVLDNGELQGVSRFIVE